MSNLTKLSLKDLNRLIDLLVSILSLQVLSPEEREEKRKELRAAIEELKERAKHGNSK